MCSSHEAAIWISGYILHRRTGSDQLKRTVHGTLCRTRNIETTVAAIRQKNSPPKWCDNRRSSESSLRVRRRTNGRRASSLSPITISFLRARVTATFMRRVSVRNPISHSRLDRTNEITIASFSRPWKPSTVSISIAGLGPRSRSDRTCGIRGDYCDIARSHASFLQLLNFADHQTSFGGIAAAQAVKLRLLIAIGAGGVDERHWLIGPRG